MRAVQENPANWMLEVTAPSNESKLGVDFSELYNASGLARCVLRPMLLSGCVVCSLTAAHL